MKVTLSFTIHDDNDQFILYVGCHNLDKSQEYEIDIAKEEDRGESLTISGDHPDYGKMDVNFR